MIQIFRTREADPQIAAKRLIEPGDTILPSRGHHSSSDAKGPFVRIMRDGQKRTIVVSQRDSALGFDD